MAPMAGASTLRAETPIRGLRQGSSLMKSWWKRCLIALVLLGGGAGALLLLCGPGRPTSSS